MKHACLALAMMLALSVIAACGGDADGGDGTATHTVASTREPGSSGSATPAGGVTSTPDPNAEPIENLSPGDQTALASDVTGGDPNLAPRIVATAPPVKPRAGTTPSVDPSAIAEPSGPPSGVRFLLDMNASEPGIQTDRDVNVGDTIRVAVVAANMPAGGNDGGMAAVQFTVNYDTSKLFAPTISNGPTTDRNPDLNTVVLGEDLAWQCLPAPEGDRDAEGGIDGDGNPLNGEAYLPCFTISRGIATGTFVIGVIEFQALASGEVDLTLTDTLSVNFLGLSIAACSPNEAPVVPCDGATLNIR